MTQDAIKIDPHDPFFVTDEELISRLNLPEKLARERLNALDADPRSAFPKKDKFWGDRRYLPHVKAYLDRDSQRKIDASRTRERTHASGR